MMRCFIISVFLCANVITAYAADIPTPKCDLRTITKTTETEIPLGVGVTTKVSLARNIRMTKRASPNHRKQIVFEEKSFLAFAAGTLGQVMQGVASQTRAQIGDACEVSISTLSGSASSSSIPPSFSLYSDGKGRKCTRFEYQCGQETKCEIRWDYQKCDTWQKFCESRQVIDISNWKINYTGIVAISPDLINDKVIIDLQSSPPNIDLGGAGDVAQALDNIGLLRAIGINASAKLPVSLSGLPTLLSLGSLPLPEITAKPHLLAANWKMSQPPGFPGYERVGVEYSTIGALLEESGCLAAGCLRTSNTTDEFNACFLAGHE